LALVTQPQSSYELKVELVTDQRTVKGTGRVRFTNNSRESLNELWFHLYLNAFKNNRSLFARSPFTAGRSGEKPQVWGYIDVHALRDARSGEDLWPLRDQHSPGDPEDETDIRVPLPLPLGAGDTLELEVQWTSQLPEIVERTGFSRDYYFVAQWFPKLAKFEPASGTFRHFAFHPQAEFYADYSDYQVTLTTPRSYQIGATGSCTASTATYPDTVSVLNCHADRVHDFAFTAWPGFEVHNETIGDTQVRLLYPAGHLLNRERTLFALRYALVRLQELYGPYPYPTLTVVHPPEHASASGGMEYPTLITTGGAWHTPWYSRGTELVTIHELAHQWFYGLLGSDEARWPFLDEGLTSYAEAKLARELFGPSSAGAFLGFTLSADAYRHAASARRGLDQAIASPAGDFRTFGHLGALAYARTASLLETLEFTHGEAFTEAMRSYAERYRFGHPTPQDLLQVLAEKLGAGVAEQARLALFERGWVDYTVQLVQSGQVPAAAGVFDVGGQRHTESTDSRDLQDSPHIGRVLVTRRGNLSFPVRVQLHDAEGQVSEQRWDGEGESTFIEWRGEHPLVGAVVDPNFQIRLDHDRLNNSVMLDVPGGGGGFRTQARLSYWAQLLLHFFGP
jgi:hypothetical protein